MTETNDIPPDVAARRAGPEVRPGPLILEAPMQRPSTIREGASGFFNPVEPDAQYRVRLNRVITDGGERFDLLEQIGYWDTEVGGIIVPANLELFRTDLTSVPDIFTWLVPKTGAHLPAALIHDGLVLEPEEPPTYIAHKPIDRETADRIFRSGMADLGTTRLRQWLVWTAVSLASMVARPFRDHWRSWLVVVATIGTIAVLGTLATVDLFDRKELLPWMGSRPTWLEALTGAVGAMVVPCLLAILWGRRWRAGLIAGVALALLLHVTVAVVLVSSIFQTAESALQSNFKRTAGSALVAVGILLGAIVIGSWGG
jgi:hypothetical protein